MTSYEQERPHLIAQCRKEILEALGVLYAIAPMKYARVCRSVLHLQVAEKHIRDDLTYLCGKGYLEWLNKPAERFMPWPERLYRLTESGKEILDGLRRDAAIEP